MIEDAAFARLRDGCVIPAHPLALDEKNRFDERHQRALTRYYLDAGAGGLAVGVHSTQFAIHDPDVGLYRPVLELASETAREFTGSRGIDPPIMIAGLVGETDQARSEAAVARELGYPIGLLSLTALRDRPLDDLIEHTEQVASVIPVMGFYLQPALSQMILLRDFWARFVEIPGVCGIKIAPFNRYYTLDVLEAVAESSRRAEIALYTGNDDSILVDLLTRHDFRTAEGTVSLRIVGGLLGQWACWTKRAVEYLDRVKEIRREPTVPQDLLTAADQLTLANAAIFDAANGFIGCIPGISYVLMRQGLLRSVGTLEPADRLSPGQTARIDAMVSRYPHLTDDEFVRANLDEWLR
jgi:dihydrodipicolinate synthase/N-acetylneuraminate lyase